MSKRYNLKLTAKLELEIPIQVSGDTLEEAIDSVHQRMPDHRGSYRNTIEMVSRRAIHTGNFQYELVEEEHGQE